MRTKREAKGVTCVVVVFETPICDVPFGEKLPVMSLDCIDDLVTVGDPPSESYNLGNRMGVIIGCELMSSFTISAFSDDI